MFNKSEDQKLINKALAGSQRAWLKLVKRYEAAVYNMTYRMTRSADDAADLMQEVFLAVYRNLPNYRGEGNFYGWLNRIATNRCIDHIRRKQRLIDEHPDFDVETTASEQPSPLGELDKNRQNKDIKNKLNLLPVEQKIIIELKFFQHLTFEEIAGQLGISSNTVKTRFYSALKKMKHFMEQSHAM